MFQKSMSFLSHNKLKVLVLLVTCLLIVQMIRLIPWLHSLQQAPDIDHGPTPDGNFSPVAVAVYYEALCPDSKNFVIKQLVPAFEKAARLITISFVAYGKASTRTADNGDLTFTCQHGPVECFANKVHACGVKAIANQSRQLEYVACMIADNYDPREAGRSCALKIGADWDSINKCATGLEGNLLLRDNGEKTHALRPRVSFIPTVTLDASQWDQRAILKNLFKEVCSHFKNVPEECQGTTL